MNKTWEIAAIGESLVDMICRVEDGAVHLTGHAGGGPANMLAAASRLGRRTAYITKVGEDVFGSFFKDAMEKESVDTRGLVTGRALTTLAIVSLSPSGERDFAFYRKETADVTLTPEEMNPEVLKSCRILHYSTVSMTVEPARSANFHAAAEAKAAGACLSFDPNYRAFLWPDQDEAAAVMDRAMGGADFVKVSEEEAEILTGVSDPEKAGVLLFEKYSPALLAVTLGAEGAMAFSAQGMVRRPSHDLGAVDTTGAGDGFWGAALHMILKLADAGIIRLEKPCSLGVDALAQILTFAAAAGAIATTKKGGIPAMASEAEILHLLEQGPVTIQ